MILGPDGKPIDVEPCQLAPKADPYERLAEWLVLMHNGGAFRHDDEEDEANGLG